MGRDPAEEASEVLADLSPDERLYVRRKAASLKTRYNSESNPGDINTWYVLAISDTAKGVNRSGHVTMVPGSRTMLMSTSRGTQNKSAKQVEVVQGKWNAAKRMMELERTENGAASKIRVPGSTARSGNLNRQAFQVTVDRQFGWRAFQSQSDAHALKAALEGHHRPRAQPTGLNPFRSAGVGAGHQVRL